MCEITENIIKNIGDIILKEKIVADKNFRIFKIDNNKYSILYKVCRSSIFEYNNINFEKQIKKISEDIFYKKNYKICETKEIFAEVFEKESNIIEIRVGLL